MEQYSRFFLPGGLFILTLASGLWVSHSGRPLSTVLITLHKLIALGSVVTLGIQFGRLMKIATPTLAVAMLAIAVVSALALFATGALLSQARPAALFILRIHQVAPLVLLVSIAASLILFQH